MDILQLITDKEEIERIAPKYRAYVQHLTHPFAFLINHKVVAKGELRFNSGEAGAAEVKMLECIEKRKGHGTLFVEYLKNMPEVTEIWGESLPESVPFWLKMGAVFEEKSLNEFLVNQELDEGFLLPFSIG